MRQKLSDYQQSMYNFLSPLASFIAVCLIVLALMSTGQILLPELTFVDVLIIALGSFRLIRFFCFDSMFSYMRDRIAYDVKVVEENGEMYVEKTSVGVGFRRMLINLFDCVWCMGIWTTLVAFLLYISSYGTKLFVYFFAIAGIATFFQLIAGFIGCKYEEADMRIDEARRNLTK